MKKTLQVLLIAVFCIIFILDLAFAGFAGFNVLVKTDLKKIIVRSPKIGDVYVNMKDGKGVFTKKIIFFTHERLVREVRVGNIKEKIYAPTYIPVDQDGLILIPEIYLMLADMIAENGEIATCIFPLIFSGDIYKFNGFEMRAAKVFSIRSLPSFKSDKLVLWSFEYSVIIRKF